MVGWGGHTLTSLGLQLYLSLWAVKLLIQSTENRATCLGVYLCQRAPLASKVQERPSG